MATLRCPTDPEHKEFVAPVVAPQRWVIRPDGKFISVVNSEHRYVIIDWANIGHYTCFVCGAIAVVDLPNGGVAWPG